MNIYVGNLNYRVKEGDLQQVMEDYGAVSSVKVVMDRETGKSKGFAFIEIFNRNAIEAHCEDRVKGIVGSMDALPFQEEELDLIWSEGAIYNIGFERGMNEWNKFLKKNGFIAVTEASWFTPERPSEIDDFWMANYPEIDTIPRKIAQMEKAGYIPTAHFILPENCWTEHFYAPQFPVQEAFLKEYAGNEAAADLIAGQRHEESLYNKYKEYYGYVFYIGQKR